MNVQNGTLKKAASAAATWKQQNPGKVLEIAINASVEAKKYWSANPVRKEAQLQAAQKAAQAANCKNWIAISPSGTEENVVNMAEFCRMNNLRYSTMAEIAKGKKGRKSHKGWRCKYA